MELADGPGRGSRSSTSSCLSAVERANAVDDDVPVKAMEIMGRARTRSSDPAIRQVAKFLVVGGTSYVLNLGLYSLALLLGLHYLMAATVAFCLGFAFNFLTNRSWTFEAGTGAVGGQFIRFCVVAAVILGLDLLLLRLAVGELGVPSVLAQAIVILLLAPLSFAGNRLWAFSARAPAPTS